MEQVERACGNKITNNLKQTEMEELLKRLNEVNRDIMGMYRSGKMSMDLINAKSYRLKLQRELRAYMK